MTLLVRGAIALVPAMAHLTATAIACNHTPLDRCNLNPAFVTFGGE